MLKPLLLPALTAALAAAFLVLVFAHTELALAAAGFALAAWLGVASISLLLRQKHSRSPMGVVLPVALAHLGAALLVAGITGSSLWKDESEAKLNVKESITAAGYGFVLKNVTAEERNNHTATRAEITVQDIRKHAFTTLAPEYRLYTNSGNRTSEAAIYSRPWQDIYTVIGETDTLGKTAMRVYVNPMMQFLWAGFLLMGAGGIAGLTHSLRRRHGPA